MSNQGTISYDVEANTSDLLSAEKAVDKSTKNIEQDFKRVDKAVDQTNAKVKKTAQGVKDGMAQMSRGAGQAGVQVQQFIGQVQGGQSAMLALSQQAADIGIVLGAPLAGAIAGISASLVGMLIPSLTDSTTGLEMLEKATENVKAAMTLSADGVVEYADEMKKLSQVSETLAQLKIVNLLAEQRAALDDAGKAFEKALDDAQGWATEYGATYKIFKKETQEARDSLRQLKDAAEGFNADNAAESVDALEKALVRATDAGLSNTKIGRELSNQLNGLIAGYKEGEKFVADLESRMKDLNFTFEDSTEETKKHADAVASLVMSLKEQAAQISETARQTALRVATEKGATQAQIESINASFDAIEADKQRIESQKELDRVMEESFRNEQKRASQEAANKKKAVGFAEGVVESGMSPVERLQQEQEQLLALKAQYVDQSALFDEALTANAKKQADLRAQYQIANANMLLSSSSQLFDGLAGIIAASGKEQSTAYKAMFALSKGFAIAQAGLNLSLAISNASAITPWYASIPAVAQTVSAGASLASAIAGATFSGGREFGGSTNRGSNYRINEAGIPEIYSQGGKDYLMNSGGGQVTPMQEITGGDTPISVTIIGGETNAQSGTVSMEDRNMIVKLSVKATKAEIANDVRSGQGNVLSAFKQSTSLTTNTKGTR